MCLSGANLFIIAFLMDVQPMILITSVLLRHIRCFQYWFVTLWDLFGWIDMYKIDLSFIFSRAIVLCGSLGEASQILHSPNHFRSVFISYRYFVSIALFVQKKKKEQSFKLLFWKPKQSTTYFHFFYAIRDGKSKYVVGIVLFSSGFINMAVTSSNVTFLTLF